MLGTGLTSVCSNVNFGMTEELEELRAVAQRAVEVSPLFLLCSCLEVVRFMLLKPDALQLLTKVKSWYWLLPFFIGLWPNNTLRLKEPTFSASLPSGGEVWHQEQAGSFASSFLVRQLQPSTQDHFPSNTEKRLRVLQ